MSSHQVLNAADHGALRVLTPADPGLGADAMAALVVPEEFRDVQGHYPIVFRKDPASGAFTAMALFGFENGENLFVDETGRWTRRYRPWSLAIQPFLVGMPADGQGDPQVHVDMAHSRIAGADAGMRVFDDTGRPTPHLDTIAELLGNLHQGFQDSGAFYAALARHELLEPFTLEVPLSDGSKQSLVGFHIIAEEAFAALDGAALGELHGAGHLVPICMAMASQAQFGALVDLKDAKTARG